jgi:transcriptional regulator with XRE-family HTH domain
MSNFNVIKEIAKQKNISIRELSSRIGKDETTLQAIFRNGSTNTRTIEDIAKVLDVPVGVFFDNSYYQKNEVSTNNGIVGIQGEGHQITNNDIAGMIELHKGYQELLKKRDEQVDRLLAIVEKQKKPVKSK